MAERLTKIKAGQEQDSEFFYLGYSPYPGKEPLKRSLVNELGYRPDNFYPNDDQSVTVEWMQVNFGFTPKERAQHFYCYVTDLVIPQLEEATQGEVRFSGEIEEQHLQLTDIRHTPGSESFKVIRQKLGSMSLFVAESTAADEPARTATA